MKKVYSKVLNFVRDIDYFGVQINFQYLSKEKHTTYFGATFALVIYGLLTYKFVTSMIEIITKSNLDFTLEEVPTFDDTIEMNNFFIGFCSLGAMMKNNSDFMATYMNFTYDIYTQRNFNPLMEFPYSLSENQCGKISNQSTYCKCLQFDNTTDYNISSNKNSIFDNQALGIHIKMNLNGLNATEGDLNMYKTIVIFTQKFYVNTSDYYSLLESTINNSQEKLETQKISMLDQYVDKLEIEKVNDIYTFGIVSPASESDYSYTYSSQHYRQYESSLMSEYESEMFYSFKHSSTSKKYTIYTFSMDTFLSNFGGYFQVIYVVFNVICQFYNNFSLQRKIKNRFKEKSMDIRKLMADLNEHLDKKQQGSPDSDPLYNIPEIPQENIPQSNNNSKIQLEFEMNQIEIKIADDIYGNFSDAKISENHKPKNTPARHSKYMSKLLNLYKPELALLITETYYKNMVEDFIEQFDFEKFYNLIKEIKLLKFFLFDEEKSFWIDHIQQIPFNIQKFDEFMEIRRGVSEKHELGSVNFFDAKLSLLKDFFIHYIYV